MEFEKGQASLRELEMMRQTVDRASDSVFWLTRDGEIIYANDAACAERGYTRTEMLGMKIFDLDPDYQPGIWERHFEDLKRHGTITLETRHRTKSGREYPIEVSANYALIGGSELNFCFLRDITERKKAESVRQAESDLLKKFASQIPGVIYQFRLRSDGSSCFPFATDAIREIYQVSPEEVREDASKVFAVLHPDDLDSVAASIQKSAQEMSLWRHEYRVKYQDGTVRWLLGNAIPEREENGATLWHGFITDVTPQKQVEELLIKTNNELEQRVEQRTRDLAEINKSLKKANAELRYTQNELIQREKMSALGVLVAGVSHEMNTPLGNSLMASSSLVEQVAKFKAELENGGVTKTRVNEYNEYMMNGLDLVSRNLNRAIEQLIHFKQVSVDQASEQRRKFELKTIVADNVSILQPQFKHTVKWTHWSRQYFREFKLHPFSSLQLVGAAPL
ncbi:PAS domain S-box-containing protein, partial [Oxalobacteraceae bacterium GrIS 2.11]